MRLLSICALGLVLVLNTPVRESVLTVVRLPLTLVKQGIAVLTVLPRLPALARENAALRTELAQARVDSARLHEALRHTEQSERLREAASSSRRPLVAVVIGRSAIPTQQTVLLNVGARHGLTQESVIVDASGLIGRVMELHPATAQVLLLTDPESRVAGLIERSREAGLLVGRGRGRCDFIYLDADADIEPGDRIVTAGLGGSFPKGLLLGRVIRVVRDEQVGAAWATVEPAAQFSRLEEVLCLL